MGWAINEALNPWPVTGFLYSSFQNSTPWAELPVFTYKTVIFLVLLISGERKEDIVLSFLFSNVFWLQSDTVADPAWAKGAVPPLPPPPPPECKNQSEKWWPMSTAAYISCFMAPFSEVSGSATVTCAILGPLVPLFWFSGDVFCGFQSQSGFCLLRVCEGECNVSPPASSHSILKKNNKKMAAKMKRLT